MIVLNKRKISQAHNTPFMQEPLASEVGCLRVGSAMQDIMNVSYVATGGGIRFHGQFDIRTSEK
jgi:hypothetical protein